MNNDIDTLQTTSQSISSPQNPDASRASDGRQQTPLEAQPSADHGLHEERHSASHSHRTPSRLTTRKVVLAGVLTALSFGLYMLGQFCKLPFMFPSFLDLQISELPALIGGIVLGPLYGIVIILFKCLLKFPFSSTMYVGEFTDMILGIAYVLPVSLIYRRWQGTKGLVVALAIGSLVVTAVAVLLNRFVSIPFYLYFYFGSNMQGLLSLLLPLFPAITEGNFYAYYLGLSIVPFNLLRALLCSVFTVLLYRRIGKLLHLSFPHRKSVSHEQKS